MSAFMRIIGRCNQSVVIGGKSYNGKEVELKLFVDGKEQGGSFSGSIKIDVHGDCEEVESMSGDISVIGSAERVKTMSGDVRCGKVSGSVKTMSGDVTIK